MQMTSASDTPRMILASSSPRRRQLLADAGYRFEVVGPPVGEPEDQHDEMLPSQLAEAMAYFKARSVWQERPNRCVLGADTVVAVGGHVLGKPDGPDDARRMLQTLSASRHCVITGVAILATAEANEENPRRRLKATTRSESATVHGNQLAPAGQRVRML